MLFYAIPIILTGLLQIFYNLADNIIVGKFSGDEFALAAVGATSELTRMIINLLMGIGAGAGIIVAQAYGAGDKNKISKAVHTSITFSLLAGIFFAALFFLAARPALMLMDINPVFIDKSILYMQITAFGVPASAVFNYSAGIVRSIGDSKTPLWILSSSGLLNVALNLFFVIFLDMSVDGVALATVISQYASAIAILFVVTGKKNEAWAFSFKKMNIDLRILKASLLLGVPQALQSAMLNFANVTLVSSMNTFDAYVFTGYTINCQFQSIVDGVMTGFIIAATVFTAHNYGAKDFYRVKKVLALSLLQVTLFGVLTGQLVLLFKKPLAMLFLQENSEGLDTVLEVSASMSMLVISLYFLVGVLGVLSGSHRGLGCSVTQMILHVSGIFGTRFIWITLIFPLIKTPIGLMICYPLSWIITILFLGVTRYMIGKKLLKNSNAEHQG